MSDQFDYRDSHLARRAKELLNNAPIDWSAPLDGPYRKSPTTEEGRTFVIGTEAVRRIEDD